MNTLTIFLEVPHFGPDKTEIEVEYTYSRKHQELVVISSAALVNAEPVAVWHLLSPAQRSRIEDECVTDHQDRMDQHVVDNRRFAHGS